MLAWLPFFLISLMFIVLLYACTRSARTNIQRFKQLSLIAFLWALTAFCYTPTSYNFGTQLVIQYIQWGPVKLNVIPFQQLDIEFWLNVLLTVPLGGLLAWNFPDLPWRRFIWLGFLTGLTLELGQFILDWLVNLKRWVDIDDVITNWAGVIIGAAGYKIARHVPGLRWLQK
ncbi:VanZ family protein [Lactiplantibacillus plantarum]|uniref:VanZ family protein n=1 Tax=Lactiplantibacillus plantarum TaxID=1590 RepID=UPI001B636563|nr:VanZ family protein [Lactiplantibacillus plantarum]MBP5844710.1 VanZ family protein [Lactiplantibacillus plantarum]MCK3676663.1 VanZ family protein [Lactiplantibacillus plantarum]UNB87197.1 VanZ family protein [Lactiplantibacillus plantarum]WQC50623.1 VanZ family protein [Lactiplantibacillus plantarum]WQG53938.1 VanZ family protein [Lactiplantibacillus plantarum]